ncbi:hypothetical protein BX661DRAFT_176316 [Kickxella alabastrina]|uniref:uncharacterized protein n=1 Tax=Kickxella alabastrina TaxID=61397 RepID=UPI00221F93AD|nr:uncharacterized protein BX661DRAFT_176316 [Kickxella alabastrina]KAI7835216.1 hypothetical protein BX661DRAFT_176316 [Kickxella alabastrina]
MSVRDYNFYFKGSNVLSVTKWGELSSKVHTIEDAIKYIIKNKLWNLDKKEKNLEFMIKDLIFQLGKGDYIHEPLGIKLKLANLCKSTTTPIDISIIIPKFAAVNYKGNPYKVPYTDESSEGHISVVAKKIIKHIGSGLKLTLIAQDEQCENQPFKKCLVTREYNCCIN